MRKVLLALVLSVLVTAQALAVPHKPVHRPGAKPVSSPIARVWGQITSILRGSKLATGDHNLPPPPSTLLAGS
jgi:hypothetical protein